MNGSRPWNTKHIRHRNDGMACERRVTKMNLEIDSKSCWVGSRGLQNRVKIGPGTPSGLPTAPKSIPRASREHLGSGSGRPRRVPGAPGGSPRAPRDTQNRVKIGPGTLLGYPVAPRSVLKASRERPGSIPGRPWDSPGIPGARRDAPETLPRRLGYAFGRHGASREGPGTDFDPIWGTPGPLPGPILV